MKINIYAEHIETTTDSFWSHSICAITRALKHKYYNVTFNVIPWRASQLKIFNPSVDAYFDKFQHETITDMTMIIENDATKKYIVVNYWDKGLAQVRTWHDYTDKCVQMLTTYGQQNNDVTYEIDENPKVIPTSFIGCSVKDQQIIDALYANRDTRIVPEKLWFNSLTPYLFREYLLSDTRFDVQGGTYMPLEQFLGKLSAYKINMDINSVAEISCRTSQILGLGQVLIRPKIRHKLKNELVDMVHYVEVKVDDLRDYTLLADAYYDTFNRVKADEDLMQFISDNARKYYEENCTLESHVKIVLDSIDLRVLE